MALRINQNIGALTAHRWTALNDTNLSKSIERLSSGFRINAAADDPAGLVISENLRGQVSGLGQAISNTQQAINMLKTAESALQEVQNLLRSMRDLALHAANTGANDSVSIAADQAQINQAIDSIDRIAEQTQFGNMKLFDTASLGNLDGKVFQVGANANQTVTLDLTGATLVSDLHAANLGDGVSYVDTIDVTSDAQGAIAVVDAAVVQISDLRVYLGSVQKNTLESNLASLSVARENVAASESSIRDVDMALEMITFTRNQILLQAGSAMLTQANQAPQVILAMLR
ncbi:MAG: flagellin [Armatimonadetes bacterium]|nr:flagellin [Armatimonadota bacterium]NIM24352.1 flagellin [Armatimonadota bacterium]NIM68221.1 flagellin [Armatimonadota bacterium]NIM75122.1 flagellin [Armatimonadota bacterium]NIN06426.1 flagellin [Armatimonadota bacterium]